jgi:hypothetical protein
MLEGVSSKVKEWVQHKRVDWIISGLSIAFWEGDKELFKLVGRNSNAVECAHHMSNSYGTGLTLVGAIYRFVTIF